MRLLLCVLLLMPATGRAQPSPADATWKRLHFLLGTWAQAMDGRAGVPEIAPSAYTFRADVGDRVLLRESPACTAQPCAHRDLLTIFREAGTVRALLLNADGRVLHFVVTTPEADTAVFTSEGEAVPVQLHYDLGFGVMKGSYSTLPAGAAGFRPVVSWSGERR